MCFAPRKKPGSRFGHERLKYSSCTCCELSTVCFHFYLCWINKRCARARGALNGGYSYLNCHYLDVKINALDHLSPD